MNVKNEDLEAENPLQACYTGHPKGLESPSEVRSESTNTPEKKKNKCTMLLLLMIPDGSARVENSQPLKPFTHLCCLVNLSASTPQAPELTGKHSDPQAAVTSTCSSAAAEKLMQ